MASAQKMDAPQVGAEPPAAEPPAAQAPEATPATPASPAAPAVAEKDPDPAQDQGDSGTIPDVRTPPGAGRATGSESTAGAPAQKAAADSPGVGKPDAVPVVANISHRFSQPRIDNSAGRKHDAAVSGVTMGSFSQPGGRPKSQFGAEDYEPAFTGIKYTFAGGKCTITASLDTICPWGTNAGGDIDVPSANAPVVTIDSAPAIKADLQPGAVTPFKSPRTKYYSQALVEQHEKFHGTDDYGWTTSTGLGIVKASIEAGTVSKATAAADVHKLIDDARTKLIAENFKWYKGAGTSHDSFAGEIRAYADGKPAYQQLADAVGKRGESLQMRKQIPPTEYREGGRAVPPP